MGEPGSILESIRPDPLNAKSTSWCAVLCHVDEGVYIGLIPLYVLVIYQPLNLLLDHLLLW